MRAGVDSNGLATAVESSLPPRLAEAKAIRGFERAFRLHFHPEWSVALVHRGTSRARIGSAWYEVSAGDIVRIPPFLPHVCNPDRKGHWSYDLLLVEDGEAAAAPASRPSEAAVVARACADCRALFREALSLRNARPLLDHLALHEGSSRPGRISVPKPAIAAAAARLAGDLRRTPHLEDLARPLGLDAAAFIRSFRREYGMPPHAWVLCLRISFAKGLLAAGYSLAYAALEAGFSDQSHLSRHFVRLVGTTPAAWARANGSSSRGSVSPGFG